MSRTVLREAVSPRRVAVLREIAIWYWDLVCPLNGPAGVRGDGGSLGLMPSTYTPSVREFERLLSVMRNQARQRAYAGWSLGTLRWHVLAYYRDAEVVIQHVPVFVVLAGKRRRMVNQDGSFVTRPERVFRRHSDSRLDRAELGLEWMAGSWGLSGEPMLPDEMVKAA